MTADSGVNYLCDEVVGKNRGDGFGNVIRCGSLSGSERSFSQNDDLSFLTWNVNGLSRYKFDAVQDFLSGFMVVCLMETWLRDGTESQFELPNHTRFGTVPANRRSERGRRSGGMLLFVSKQIETLTTKLEARYLRNNMLWLKYTPESGKRCVVGFLYNPPKDSPFAIPDIYEELCMALESVMLYVDPHNKQDSTVVILGDHNARTGQLLDSESVVSEGAFQPELLADVAEDYVLPDRRSHDSVVNYYGRCLLEFCKSTEMRIMNGRVAGCNDGYTYISTAGQSTIDYALVNTGSWHLIKNMTIHSRVESDHLPLSISFMQKTTVIRKNYDITGDAILTYKIERFRWNVKWTQNYLTRVTFFTQFLLGLVNLIHAEPHSKLDSYIGYMQKLFEFAGSRMLEKPSSFTVDHLTQKIQKLKSKAKQKLWLFRKCRTNEILCDYLSAKLRWNEKRKETLRRKQEKEKVLLETAIKSKDTKILWNQIKRITKGGLLVNSSFLPGQWLQHFSQVYNVVIGYERNEWHAPNLSHVDDILDTEISPLEVKWAVSSMKNNKAPGWDGIPVEFFKYSATLISPVFARLFNILYEEALYPESWALSIIQPIFKKKGSPNDPDNWRGIALLPTIAKIYTKVLCTRLKKWASVKKPD